MTQDKDISLFMITLMLIIGVLAFILWQELGCSCGVSPNPPSPPVPPEAGTTDDCPAACERLAELQCPGWEGSYGTDSEAGTIDDIPCVDVCIEVLESDPSMTLFPACTAQSGSCEEIDLCFEGGGK